MRRFITSVSIKITSLLLWLWFATREAVADDLGPDAQNIEILFTAYGTVALICTVFFPLVVENQGIELTTWVVLAGMVPYLFIGIIYNLVVKDVNSDAFNQTRSWFAH